MLLSAAVRQPGTHAPIILTQGLKRRKAVLLEMLCSAAVIATASQTHDRLSPTTALVEELQLSAQLLPPHLPIVEPS